MTLLAPGASSRLGAVLLGMFVGVLPGAIFLVSRTSEKPSSAVHETSALAHDAHRAPDHGSEHAGAMPIGIFQCGNFDGVGHCLPPIITSMRLLRGARCSERLDAHATLPVKEDDNFKLVIFP